MTKRDIYLSSNEDWVSPGDNLHYDDLLRK